MNFMFKFFPVWHFPQYRSFLLQNNTNSKRITTPDISTNINGEYTNCLNSCELFNFTSQTWSLFASLPLKMSAFPMVSISKRIFTFGGYLCGYNITNSNFMFDRAKWMTIQEYPFNARFLTATPIDNDRILVYGGNFINCYSYSILTNSFIDVKPLAQRRYGNSMVMIDGN
jgi:hypothetical protein